jgi:hypothetical protein
MSETVIALLVALLIVYLAPELPTMVRELIHYKERRNSVRLAAANVNHVKSDSISQQVTSGTWHGVTDGRGYITIEHGLGTTPEAAWTTSDNANHALTIYVLSVTFTHLVLFVTDRHGNPAAHRHFTVTWNAATKAATP